MIAMSSGVAWQLPKCIIGLASMQSNQLTIRVRRSKSIVLIVGRLIAAGIQLDASITD